MTFLLSPISHHFVTQRNPGGVCSAARALRGCSSAPWGAGALRRPVRPSAGVQVQHRGVGRGQHRAGALPGTSSPSIAFRFLLGIGMGAEFPVAAAILAEFMPSSNARPLRRPVGGSMAAWVLSRQGRCPTCWWHPRSVGADSSPMQAVLAVIALLVPPPICLNHPGGSPRAATQGAAERTLAGIEDCGSGGARDVPCPKPRAGPMEHTTRTSEQGGGLRGLFSFRDSGRARSPCGRCGSA